MSKLTDNEIKKALECCIKSSHFGECFENKCPAVSEKGCKVGKETLYPYALDLINRLQAKVEFYKKNRDKYQDDVMYLSKQCDDLQAENERLEKELKITRAYLHDSGLEYDLLSYSERIGR